MNVTLQKCQDQYHRKLPFVLYRKPNGSQVIGLLQGNDQLFLVSDFQEKGFVFAPFDGDEIVLLPENRCEVSVSPFDVISTKIENDSKVEIDNNATKQKHINLVENAVKAIKRGNFSKVVLSRKEAVALSDFDLFDTFHRLAKTYPSTFAYCFFHPKVGLWLGAFSEQLLFVKGNYYSTMAVAGTQITSENAAIEWKEKEIEEQSIVVDFIVSNLKSVSDEINVSQPYNMYAGNLVHIKTDIEGQFADVFDIKKVLSFLHPTPAVCGFPKNEALNFIQQYEGYNRAYYSGYLGELNMNFETKEFESDLYVNLRCLKIEESLELSKVLAHLYVGGGITKESDPEKEWEETVNKSRIIKDILK